MSSARSKMRKRIAHCVESLPAEVYTVRQMAEKLLSDYPDIKETFADDVFVEFAIDDIRRTCANLSSPSQGELALYYSVEQLTGFDEEGNPETRRVYAHVSAVLDSDDLTRSAVTLRCQQVKGAMREVEKLVEARRAKNPKFQMSLPW